MNKFDRICSFFLHFEEVDNTSPEKLQKLLTEKCSFGYSRDTALEISMAEFGHIFLQFHGHVYLVQGIYQVFLVYKC